MGKKKGQLKIQNMKFLRNFNLGFSKKSQLKIQVCGNQRFPGLVSLNKKSQLKIQEMAFMIVAVFLFFILVGMFVLSLVFMNVREEANKIAEDRTLSSLSNLADSPEFSCVASKSNCIDSDKLITLVGRDVYQNFWPYNSLKVVRFSGFGKSEGEMVRCDVANYPDCDLFIVYDKGVVNERALSSFVALCRKEYENEYTYDKCEIAKLVGGTEIRKGE